MKNETNNDGAPKIDEADFNRFVELEKGADAKAQDAKDIEASLEENTPAGETTADEEKPEPESGAEAAKAVDAELLAKSTQALRRYGMTAKMIDKLSGEEIVEAGAKLLKIQEDNDKAHTELKTLKLGKEKPEAEGKTPAPAKADLSKWQKRLEDKFGDDVAPDLAEFVTEYVGELTKDFASKVQALEAAHARSVVDAAMREVSGEYPGLKDKATRDLVLEKAQKIASAYEDEVSCLRDACKLLDLPTTESLAEAKSTGKAAAQARKNGLPSTNGRTPPVASLSKSDLEMKAMLAFEDGNTQEGQRLMALAGRAQ